MNLQSLQKLQKQHESTPFIPSTKIEANSEVTLRIVPGSYGEDGTLPFLPVVRHWLNPFHRKPVLCLEFHGADGGAPDGKPCPVCTARKKCYEMEKKVSELERASGISPNTAIQRKIIAALLKAFQPETKFYALVVNRAGNVLQEYPSPKTVFDAMCNHMASNATSDFIDPYTGHDFVISRKDQNRRTSYAVTPKVSSSPLADSSDKIEDILAKAAELPLMRRVNDPESLLSHEAIADFVEKIIALKKQAAADGTLEVDSEVSEMSSSASGVFGDSPAPMREPVRQQAPAPLREPAPQPAAFTPSASAFQPGEGIPADDDFIPMDYTGDPQPLPLDPAPSRPAPQQASAPASAPAPAPISDETSSLLDELGNFDD